MSSLILRGIRCRSTRLRPCLGPRAPISRSSFNVAEDSIKEQKYLYSKTIIGTTSEIYDVISEVSKYQEFIPFCIESFVNKRSPQDNTPIEAGLRVGFQQYDDKFVCEVKCEDSREPIGGYSVEATSLSHNLFYFLYAQWLIKPHTTRKNSSEVELLMRYKLKSPLYNAVSSIFAKSATTLVMKAFERRVHETKRKNHVR